MITGDNRLIALHVSEMVGMPGSKLLVCMEVDRLTSDALVKRVNEVDVFAEIEPRQKERIILALKRAGNVVGYMGDGVNDAPALHAADVGISVANASDIVKEEADLVLLHKNLDVLAEGIREGRRTFTNTLKYVFMATSANFGNMFSTAVASFFLSFLPMLPKQILLTNLLTDRSVMMIAPDAVDSSTLQRPRRRDIGFIRKFMTVFGSLSAVFDFATFGILMLLLHANVEQFRTAWFIESVVSASLVVLIVRTQKPLHRSRLGKYLLLATVIVAIIAATVIPLAPIGSIFNFVILPLHLYAWIAAIVVLYLASAESLKILFYRKK
jgi:Mg2+-importing ATPase